MPKNNIESFVSFLIKKKNENALFDLLTNNFKGIEANDNPYLSIQHLKELYEQKEGSPNNEIKNDKEGSLSEELTNMGAEELQRLKEQLGELNTYFSNATTFGQSENSSICRKVLQAIEKDVEIVLELTLQTEKKEPEKRSVEVKKPEKNRKEIEEEINIDWSEYECSLTRQIFQHPVTVLDSSRNAHTYELEWLAKHIEKNGLKSPKTNLPITQVFEARETKNFLDNNAKKITEERYNGYQEKTAKEYLAFIEQKIRENNTAVQAKPQSLQVRQGSDSLNVLNNAISERQALLPQPKRTARCSVFGLGTTLTFFTSMATKAVLTGAVFNQQVGIGYAKAFNANAEKGCEAALKDASNGISPSPASLIPEHGIYKSMVPPAIGVGVGFAASDALLLGLATLSVQLLRSNGWKNKLLGVAFLFTTLAVVGANYGWALVVNHSDSLYSNQFNEDAYHNGYAAGSLFTASGCPNALVNATELTSYSSSDFIAPQQTTNPIADILSSKPEALPLLALTSALVVFLLGLVIGKRCSSNNIERDEPQHRRGPSCC